MRKSRMARTKKHSNKNRKSMRKMRRRMMRGGDEKLNNTYYKVVTDTSQLGPK